MANKKGNNYIIDEENNIAKIELRRRRKESLWVTIDLDDLDKVLNFPYTWFALKYNSAVDDYYAGCSIYHPEYKQSRPYYMHQLIIGKQGEGKRIDHINRDIRDNRKANLRVVTIIQNATNRTKKNSNNKSGYRNVSWNKSSKTWMVQLQIDGKNVKLKDFPYDKLDEAGEYAEKMRQKYYGEYAGDT